MTLWQSKRKYVVPVAAWLAAAAWWVASGERTAADDLVPPSLSAVVRIEEDRIRIDLRTVPPEHDVIIVDALLSTR